MMRIMIERAAVRVAPKRALSICFGVALLAGAASAALAQEAAPRPASERGRLRLESVEALQPKSSGHVVVDVDGALIKFATAMLDGDDPEEREVRHLVLGLRGVYVRSYEFKTGGQYAEADLSALRGQLRAPEWSRVVDLKTGDGGSENVEFYLATVGGRVEGLALVSAEPNKVTVVNVVGAIDLEKLRKLGGHLGIPKISVKK